MNLLSLVLCWCRKSMYCTQFCTRVHNRAYTPRQEKVERALLALAESNKHRHPVTYRRCTCASQLVLRLRESLMFSRIAIALPTSADASSARRVRLIALHAPNLAGDASGARFAVTQSSARLLACFLEVGGGQHLPRWRLRLGHVARGGGRNTGWRGQKHASCHLYLSVSRHDLASSLGLWPYPPYMVHGEDPLHRWADAHRTRIGGS